MLRRTLVAVAASVASVLSLSMFTAAAKAEDIHPGPFELTLGGSGSNDRNFHDGSVSLNGSFGVFVLPPLELSIRQDATYGTVGRGSSAWAAHTRGAVDFHIPLGHFWPFIGANIGYYYGNGVNDSAFAAPEAGLKVFVNDSTFLYGSAEYAFFFNTGDTDFDKGQFLYNVGIGFRF